MTSYTLERSVLVPTPLGQLRCRSLLKSKEPLESYEPPLLLARSFVPDLPEGMSVEGCVGVLFQYEAKVQLSGLRYECEWVRRTAACTGPETGEALDAQGWDNGTAMVMVGTEDENFLSARLLPPIAFGEGNYDVDYSEDGLAVCFARFPAGSSLDLHFVIAWNPSPEPANCSCWYAVGTPHRALLAEVGH